MHTIQNLRRLTVFRGLLTKDPLSTLLQTKPSKEQAEIVADWLHRLMIDDTLKASPERKIAQDPWEAWLIQGVLTDENPWTVRLERGERPSRLIAASAARDLDLLAAARHALGRVMAQAGYEPITSKSQENVTGDNSALIPNISARSRLVRLMVDSEQWAPIASEIAQYMSTAMAGPFNTAYAFRYENERFWPILRPDPITLEELTGYEKERKRVLTNTERLLERLPAHNLLLYGDRGTGKSATVKALVHRYGDEGLRLVEIAKSSLHDLPAVMRYLAGRSVPTILFFDDLSFEETETEYKELKAALEGSLEPMAHHVRIYATSNRRHLITERFHDRRGGAFGTAADEVRSQDGVQEKLSLSDRFGQTIIFPTPSQQAYLDIVFALADRYGVTMPEDELATEALRWATWHNGRSARTARQFIDGLTNVSKVK